MAEKVKRQFRCAIYTRKSHEEGLEQEFNSLDAQRESCENYIASQKGNGWLCLPEHYDDGGFSGGNMNRPALQKLKEDIKAGLIDIIVIYKIDRLLRKYGYHGTPATLEAVKNNEDLRNNLGAAAHMIHGSSEGRFRITYCPGEHMSREEIEGVGFNYGDLEEMMEKYDVKNLKDGFNTVNGEEVFYFSNPALGLWR